MIIIPTEYYPSAIKCHCLVLVQVPFRKLALCHEDADSAQTAR